MDAAPLTAAFTLLTTTLIEPRTPAPAGVRATMSVVLQNARFRTEAPSIAVVWEQSVPNLDPASRSAEIVV